MQKLTFNKSEKLCSKILIDRLFSNNNGFNNGCIRVVHINVDDSEFLPNCKVLISVSKKKVKNASKRSPIKRRIRESYRLNKSILNSALIENKSKICLAIIYRSKEDLSYKEIESKIILSLQRLAKIYGKSDSENGAIID